MPDNNKNNYDYDLGDMIDSAVQFGTQVGSSVLGSIADALEQAGDAMTRAAAQPDSFSAWKRRLERKWKNGGQSVGVVLRLWAGPSPGCFGIAALVLGILTAVGAGTLGLTPDEFVVLPILTAVFTRSRWVSVHGHCGYEKAQLLWPPAQTAASRQRLDLRPAIPGPQGPN